jgi:5'-deoxynucleotidase
MKTHDNLPPSSFCAYLSRLKHIQRWSLMRNNDEENVMEHSWMVAVIAHGLAVLHNKKQGEKVDVGQVVLKALYHDVTEVMTGDLPTPVKYHSPKMQDAFGELETLASERLLKQIPADHRHAYSEVLQPHDTSLQGRLVKAADRISAWLKCVEERRTGNQEFQEAELVTLAYIEKFELACVQEWMAIYAPAFEMSLDKLGSLGIESE